MRIYYSFILSLFTLLVFCITSVDANAMDRCPRHKVKTNLKAKRLKTSFQRGTIASINEYTQSHSGTVLAFVQSDVFDVESKYKFRLKDIGSGRVCVMLDKVDARFVVRNRIVMPSDIKPNSCEYKLILTHEKRHLKVNYDFHEEYTPKYRAYLGRIAKTVPVSSPASTPAEVERAQQKIVDYFAQKYYDQVQSSIAEVRKRQSKIDSRQEYLFLGRKIDRCASQEKEDSKSNSKVFIDRDDE